MQELYIPWTTFFLCPLAWICTWRVTKSPANQKNTLCQEIRRAFRNPREAKIYFIPGGRDCMGHLKTLRCTLCSRSIDLIFDSSSHGRHGEQDSDYNYKVWLDGLQGEIFYEQNRLGTLTRLISSILLIVRGNSKDGAFEDIVETTVTGSFHSGAFKHCSSKSG